MRHHKIDVADYEEKKKTLNRQSEYRAYIVMWFLVVTIIVKKKWK